MPFEEIESTQTFRRRTNGVAGLGRWIDRSGILGLRGGGFGVVPGADTREALVAFLNKTGRSDLAVLATPTRNTTDPVYYNLFTYVLSPNWESPTLDGKRAGLLRTLSAPYTTHYPPPDAVRGVQAKFGASQDGKLGPITAGKLAAQLPDWRTRPWRSGEPKSILDALGATAKAGGGGTGPAPAPKPAPKPAPPGPIVVDDGDGSDDVGGRDIGRRKITAAGFFSPTVLIVSGLVLAAVAIVPGLLKGRRAAPAAAA